MKTLAVRIAVAVSLVLAGATTPCRAAGADAPLRQTSELISVLKSNYVDRDKLNEKLLNDATVTGILEALGRGVVIVAPETPSTNDAKAVTNAAKATVPLARSEVIDPNIGYIRLSDVTDGTPAALDAELKGFADAKVMGYVLDLRFADGTNYAAAAAVASRFLGDGQELFTLKSSEQGAQVFRAGADGKATPPEGTDLTSAPLMLLVNAETRGSAEALAGALRAQDRGIVIGSQTAGSAAGWENVKLGDGRTLRLATAKIVLAQPSAASQPIDLFPNGITPDVAVKIDPHTEREVVLSAAQTNETLTASLQPRVHKKDLTEAQLVKAFRGQAIDGDELSSAAVRKRPPVLSGQAIGADEPATDKEHDEEGEIQNVRDVVLQRAVDILKGIRVLLSWE
jgi:C-terminal processing protease CtpA/Prc